MSWNSTSPLGSTSVKANRTIQQQNTTYIETTMGNSIVGTNTNTTRDHFWDVGTSEDGRHRWIQSPAFTVGGNPADAVLGVGMDSVLYPKTTNSRVEWFHRNSSGIYQFMPSFISGSVAIASTSTYVTIVAIPASVYGEIFIWQQSTRDIQSGSFMSDGTVVEGFSNTINIKAEGDNGWTELLNGSGAVDLNLKIRRDKGDNATYDYRIIYRAI